MTAEVQNLPPLFRTIEKGNPMFDFDASCLPCEENFKRNINIANVDLDHQENKPIQKRSDFVDSLLASTPYKFRGGQERR